MRLSTIQLIQRIFTFIGFIALFGILVIVAQTAGYEIPGLGAFGGGSALPDAPRKQVAIISGHAGSDSGAICTDANDDPTLTEVALTAQIAAQVVERMGQEAFDALLLDEYDERLTILQADVLVSLHIDSCIPTSGYKAAYSEKSTSPEQDQRLINCIDIHYPQATEIAYHPNTLTHDMLGYHAFSRVHPTTPAAILEMGLSY